MPPPPCDDDVGAAAPKEGVVEACGALLGGAADVEAGSSAIETSSIPTPAGGIPSLSVDSGGWSRDSGTEGNGVCVLAGGRGRGAQRPPRRLALGVRPEPVRVCSPASFALSRVFHSIESSCRARSSHSPERAPAAAVAASAVRPNAGPAGPAGFAAPNPPPPKPPKPPAVAAL